jgi:hypothetical protein
VGTVGSITGRVSYVGGTGNDVTITTLSSTLNPAITLAPSALPAMTVGTAVTTTLAAGGGSAPYVITLTGGSLPAGLSFSSSTNQITGTPTTPGAYSVTFTATDNTAGYNTFTYTGTVAASVPTMSDGFLWLTALGMLGAAIIAARRARVRV